MLKYHFDHLRIFTYFCMMIFLMSAPISQAAHFHKEFGYLLSNNLRLEHLLDENIDDLESIIPVLERKKALEIALPYFHRFPQYTERLLGEAILYFPYIEKVLAKYHLPEDLKYIPIFESSLVIDAKSRAGAAGLWQFMPQTGRQYGLIINNEIDERMDFKKSTEVAARYLKTLYEEFNDWSLVLMAYNGGPNRIKRIIREQNTSDVRTIMGLMPKESRTYLSKMIAAKLIFMTYPEYNLTPVLPSPEKLYFEYATFDSHFDLLQVSKKHQIDYQTLRAENPHLLNRTIRNRGKAPILVRIPKYSLDQNPSNQFRIMKFYLDGEHSLEELAKTIQWNPETIRLYNGDYHHTIPPGKRYFYIPVHERDYVSLMNKFGPQPVDFLQPDLEKKILNIHIAQVRRDLLHLNFPVKMDQRAYYMQPGETLLDISQRLNISMETILRFNPNLNLHLSSRIFLPTESSGMVAAKG